MIVRKRNWTRFIPFFHVYFSLPYLSINAAINIKDLGMFRMHYVRYELTLYKWHWDIDLYSVGEDFLGFDYLGIDEGIRIKNCNCVMWEDKKIKVFCKKHWEAIK